MSLRSSWVRMAKQQSPPRQAGMDVVAKLDVRGLLVVAGIVLVGAIVFAFTMTHWLL
jgi:hypothetical protein